MQATTSRSCDDCGTDVQDGARFCRSCGASVAPPPTCPKCAATVPPDARFCASCGAKLVGPRPAPAVAEAPAPVVAATAAPPPASPPPSEAAPEIPATSSYVPPPIKKPTSSIGSNVLLFVAFLLVLVVAIYEMNKDAPKSVSPFEGGPPMAGGGMGAPAAGGMGEPAGEGEALPAGDPISGSVTVAGALGSPPGGILFVIVRNKGMPNKGPPLAVKRIAAPSFPANFTVSADDMMMKGLPFAGPFDLYVRLDADGDPMTKAPGDLINGEPKSGVVAGAKDVEIQLDQRI